MGEKAVCPGCPHCCSLNEGEYGLCRARKADGGRVIPANYGKITSLALDPVEKKPLRRFFPGSLILSVGSFGCNYRCPFCQNHGISQISERDALYRYVPPESLASMALDLRSRGNIGIAFTYNEPSVSWEYILDTAEAMKGTDLKLALVTNGGASPEVWDSLMAVTDAANIDLKSFSERFYRRIGGDLETVKRNIEAAARSCHVELTTLIIPGENDSPDEMSQIAEWVSSVDPEIPLHVTRFFPRWRMTDREATDPELVRSLASVAAGYLRHVYTGNC